MLRSRATALARCGGFDATDLKHCIRIAINSNMASYHIKAIAKSTFDDVLLRYAAAVPEPLRDLDASRYDTIPAAAAKRTGSLHLAKDEVEKLVEWKL